MLLHLWVSPRLLICLIQMIISRKFDTAEYTSRLDSVREKRVASHKEDKD